MLRCVPGLLSRTIWPAPTFSASSNDHSIYITTVIIKSNGTSSYNFSFYIVQGPQPPEGIRVLVSIRALVWLSSSIGQRYIHSQQMVMGAFRSRLRWLDIRFCRPSTTGVLWLESTRSGRRPDYWSWGMWYRLTEKWWHLWELVGYADGTVIESELKFGYFRWHTAIKYIPIRTLPCADRDMFHQDLRFASTIRRISYALSRQLLLHSRKGTNRSW